MKSRHLVMGAAFLLSCAPLVQAESPVDLRPSVSLLYSHVFEDSARGSDEGRGAYLSGTWRLSERWGVELGYRVKHEFDARPGTEPTDSRLDFSIVHDF